MEDLIRDSSPEDTAAVSQEAQLYQTPIAAFHPSLGLLQINSSTGGLQSPGGKNMLDQSEDVHDVDMAKEDDSQQSLVISQEGELDGGGGSGLERCDADSAKTILVHNEEGPYMMEASKWPILELMSELDLESPSLTQEQIIPAARDDTGTHGWEKIAVRRESGR
ncbi:hypothetical protein C2845_PM11G24220 [Panicum miliaceum]|uniref:Uncharacterized protein n=1 Tax=Panicum miliaceum TaxID=4540 RepID=A0A3L6RP47_PANMI|nr:hypothetical protein C2845_PM11G24220 [Panicum miliaceum]